MILAILQRWEAFPGEEPFTKRLNVMGFFHTIAEKYGVLLFPIASTQQLDTVADFCDGLIVTGTPSFVHPRYYGEQPLAGIDYSSDEYPLDRAAIAAFDKRHKPMLGICGGMQSLNVFFGGTLSQRLEQEHNGAERTHSVRLTPGSLLEKTYRRAEITVNTFHHQAVKTAAPGFTVTAVSEDGVIEAMERDRILAVQWHPEVMLDYPLFETFFSLF